MVNHGIYMYNPMKVVGGVGCYETINIDLKSGPANYRLSCVFVNNLLEHSLNQESHIQMPSNVKVK